MLNVEELKKSKQVKLPNGYMVLTPGQTSRKVMGPDGKEVWDNQVDITKPGMVILGGGKNKGKVLLTYSDIEAIVRVYEEHKDYIQHNVNLDKVQKLKEMKTFGADVESLLVLAESWGLDKDEVRKMLEE